MRSARRVETAERAWQTDLRGKPTLGRQRGPAGRKPALGE